VEAVKRVFKLLSLLTALNCSSLLFCQTTSAASAGLDPHLEAALKDFYRRCGSVPLNADPDRSFAHWISSRKPTGWRQYPAKAEPWNQWDGSFEAADVFREPKGMLVNLWAASDTGDWSLSTYYCFDGDGKTSAIFASRGEVPEEELAFVEQQPDAEGHFRVTQSECYPTGPKPEATARFR
jgi:hypothetical protein